MHPARMVRGVFLILLLALLLLRPDLAEAEQPLHVTTDDHAYCEVLLDRISTAPGGRNGQVSRLVVEGATLCASGHPRSGIAKLRRALRVAMAGVE